MRTTNVGMVKTLLERGAKVSLTYGDNEAVVADSYGNTHESVLLQTAVANCAGNRYFCLLSVTTFEVQ